MKELQQKDIWVFHLFQKPDQMVNGSLLFLKRILNQIAKLVPPCVLIIHLVRADFIIGAGPPDKVIPKGGGLKQLNSELVNLSKL